jgi:hypothetical protein
LVKLNHSADDGLARSLIPFAERGDRSETEAEPPEVATKIVLGKENLSGTDITELLELAVGIESVPLLVAVPDDLVAVGKECVANFMADRKILPRRGSPSVEHDF